MNIIRYFQYDIQVGPKRFTRFIYEVHVGDDIWEYGSLDFLFNGEIITYKMFLNQRYPNFTVIEDSSLQK